MNFLKRIGSEIYRVAIYIRLSFEDYGVRNGKEESSVSVENQKAKLIKYVKDNGHVIADIYIDDGYTGTNFDRPAFKRMIKDIEAGKIDMVITKDLSRLGRNYYKVGEFMEEWFPLHGVRYIAVDDGIDTGIVCANNDIAPFKAAFNDMISKDTSNKIRSVLKAKQEDGQWVGGCTPLGYSVDQNDKHKLIINKKEAKLVKRIFKMFLDGICIKKICSILTDEKVPTFSELRGRKIRPNHVYGRGIWQDMTVKRILQNQLYTGDMVQNRRHKLGNKINKIVPNPKEEWIIVENTHEPIISKPTFQRVQELLQTKKHTLRKNKKESLEGLLFCKECGHKIGLKSPDKRNHRYTVCNFYRSYSKMNVCTNHFNNYEKLEKEVFSVLRKFLGKVDTNQLFNDLKNFLNENGNSAKLQSDLKDIEFKIYQLKNNLDKVYIDKLNGAIDNDLFERVYIKISDEIKDYNNQKDKIQMYLNEMNEEKNNENVIEIINEFKRVRKPSRKLCFQLINKIEISQDKEVNIELCFKRLDILYKKYLKQHV